MTSATSTSRNLAGATSEDISMVADFLVESIHPQHQHASLLNIEHTARAGISAGGAIDNFFEAGLMPGQMWARFGVQGNVAPTNTKNIPSG